MKTIISLKKVNPHLILLCLSVFMFQACSKKIEQHQTNNKDYAAEKLGRIRIYNVDSIIFNINTGFGKPYDTIRFLEKHEIKEIRKDQTGKDYFYILVSTNEINNLFQEKYAYKSQLSNIDFQKTIDNQKKIALIFPAIFNKTWDANLYNNSKNEQKYRYVVSDEMINQSRIYADQIIVRKKKEILPITESFANFEIYAKDTGMVYSLDYYINIQQKQDGTTFYEEQIGYKIIRQLIDFK